jgi:hypothetical protein
LLSDFKTGIVLSTRKKRRKKMEIRVTYSIAEDQLRSLIREEVLKLIGEKAPIEESPIEESPIEESPKAAPKAAPKEAPTKEAPTKEAPIEEPKEAPIEEPIEEEAPIKKNMSLEELREEIMPFSKAHNALIRSLIATFKSQTNARRNAKNLAELSPEDYSIFLERVLDAIDHVEDL